MKEGVVATDERTSGTQAEAPTSAGPHSAGGLRSVTGPAQARRVATTFDRATWLQISVDEVSVRCRLHGTRHRRPRSVAVSLAAALALAADGIPTLVSTTAAHHESEA